MVSIDIRDNTNTPQRTHDFAGGLWRTVDDDPSAALLQRVILADLVAALAALMAAVRLFHIDLMGWELVAPALWLLAMVRAGAYDRKRLLMHGLSPSSVIAAASAAVVGVAIAGVLFFSEVNVRQGLRVTGLLLGATLVARALVSFWVAGQRRRGRMVLPVLARGPQRELQHYSAMLANDPTPTYEVVAVQATDREIRDVDPGPLRPRHEPVRVPRWIDPVDAAMQQRASAVVMVGSTDLPSEQLRRTIWRCEQEGIDMLMLPIVEPVAPPMVVPAHRGGPLSMVFQGPNRQLFGLKTVLDRAVAGLGLLLVFPFFVAIALLVRNNSAGPALFRQTRVGRNGRHFTMLKFRTMCVDAEDRRAELLDLNQHSGGTLFKVREDPRVTSVGRFLRRYSLDELPQLINVVRGEMSLVGPRPPLPDEVANYPVDSMRRFTVNPGLTGLWQVSGRSDVDPLEAARLDTQYVEHWSMGMDMRILAKTAKVVVTGAGAY